MQADRQPDSYELSAVVVHICDPSSREVEGQLNHPPLQRKLEASLGFMKPHLIKRTYKTLILSDSTGVFSTNGMNGLPIKHRFVVRVSNPCKLFCFGFWRRSPVTLAGLALTA